MIWFIFKMTISTGKRVVSIWQRLISIVSHWKNKALLLVSFFVCFLLLPSDDEHAFRPISRLLSHCATINISKKKKKEDNL